MERKTWLPAAVALAAGAAFVQWRAYVARQTTPPVGRFIEVDGVRLHYVDIGTGKPLVLLHGNGGMVQDFLLSGLVGKLTDRYRVLVFDRPGFGWSSRPRTTLWTPQAQATLIYKALRLLEIEDATVVGHSWGTMVAVWLARNFSQTIKGTVLVSGFYYPQVRADAPMSLPSALPVVGDVLRHSIVPIISRLMWPLMLRKIFGPRSVTPAYTGFPKELALSPGQQRSVAEEAVMMIPAAYAMQNEYKHLKGPLAIVAGKDDRIVNTNKQSVRLHKHIPQSTLNIVPGAGHMVHHTHTAAVIEAIDAVGAAMSEQSRHTDTQKNYEFDKPADNLKSPYFANKLKA